MAAAAFEANLAKMAEEMKLGMKLMQEENAKLKEANKDLEKNFVAISNVSPKPSIQVAKRNPTLQTSWKYANSSYHSSMMAAP